MKKTGLHILRVGLGITFVWIGILIFKFPDAWGGYLQPWALNLLPIPLATAMMETAALDIIIGLLLLMNVGTWIAAGLASLHLIVVLIASGITDITVRDIGLLAGSVALLIESLPASLTTKFLKNKI